LSGPRKKKVGLQKNIDMAARLERNVPGAGGGEITWRKFEMARNTK